MSIAGDIIVAISGAGGFIGSNLIKNHNLSGNFKIITLSRKDLEDPSSSILKLPKLDFIINLASHTSIDESWINPYKYLHDNYNITLKLLEIARKNNSKFIQLSSYVYGVPNYLPIDEMHDVKTYNPYSSSKIASENLCIDYFNLFNISSSILRLFNIYGPGQDQRFLIPYLLDASMTGKKIKIRDLSIRRDYLWIGDLIKALELLILNFKEGSHVYNLGYGKSYSALEIISEIEKNSGKINYSLLSKSSEVVVKDCIADTRKFSTDFSWKPEISFDEGIKKIFEDTKRK